MTWEDEHMGDRIRIEGDTVFIKLGPVGMAAFEAADWRVDRPEPGDESRFYVKDISVRKDKKAPFGLLEVVFENGGNQVWWRPKWDDVRDLFYKAYMTDICNMGKNIKELSQFRDVAKKVVELSGPGHTGLVEGE